MTDYYAVTMLMCYFMFLFGILYMTRNVERIAHNRMVEAVVDKVRYNFRDLPRVNYKEDDSSEEDAAPEASEEESEVESELVIRKRRREPNPMARMIEEVD